MLVRVYPSPTAFLRQTLMEVPSHHWTLPPLTPQSFECPVHHHQIGPHHGLASFEMGYFQLFCSSTRPWVNLCHLREGGITHRSVGPLSPQKLHSCVKHQWRCRLPLPFDQLVPALSTLFSPSTPSDNLTGSVKTDDCLKLQLKTHGS